jgi:hypothetical protein
VTARILGIELRRSATLWAVLVSFPLAAFAPGEVGRGLMVLAGDQRQLLSLSVPLALGIGAWQARRDRRARMEELLATTPRPRWRRVLPTAVAVAVGAVVGCWGVFAAFAAPAAFYGGYQAVAALPVVAVTSLFLLAAAWSGQAIGSLVPWVLTPPLLVVAGFVAILWPEFAAEDGGALPRTMLLLPVLPPGPGYLGAYTAATHLAQGLWALAVAGAMLVLLGATGGRRLVAIAPLVVGLVAVVPLLPREPVDTYSIDAGATAPVCTTDTPRVCVIRVHHLSLDGMREPARRALEVLAARLPDDRTPTSVVEVVQDPASGRTHPSPRPDVLHADLHTVGWYDGMGRIAVSDRDVLWNLLLGAGTLPCPNAAPWPSAERQRHETARLVAAAWLLDEEPQGLSQAWWGWLPGPEVTASALATLRALPPAEQRARVAELRAAELTCDRDDRRDRLAILLGDERR